MADYPIVHARDAATFEAWLAEHHATTDGIWLALAKKSGAKTSVSYDEAVEIALCWGWIDGQVRALDTDYRLIRFTPRRARSVWSKRNVERVERLIAAGRMQAPGLAEVERAKADGRWDKAYDSQSTMAVPDDFAAALAQHPTAAAFFDTLNKTNRYAILYRIHEAKKPETRARRIEKFLGMLERGERLY